MKQPAMLFEGKPRRIILSEQGFHTPAGPDGETQQAAAYCYAYKKIEALEGIDSFILHRHVDHPHEGGLMLGLRHLHSKGGGKKKSWDCFKAADTSDWEKSFKFALKVIGIDAWK